MNAFTVDKKMYHYDPYAELIAGRQFQFNWNL